MSLPAHDYNMNDLMSLESSSFYGHIRASSTSPCSVNVHPFRYNGKYDYTYTLCHNGGISGNYKHYLHASCDYNLMANSDTGYAFNYMLSYLDDLQIEQKQ